MSRNVVGREGEEGRGKRRKEEGKRRRKYVDKGGNILEISEEG
ncbi:MAG: hypothetical protein ACREQ5_18555 [Candidatus Dormibacteria bacterium]